MNALTEKFVEEHASDNLDRLLLNASKYPDVDVAWAVHQIDARRRMGAKLPSWVENTKLRFPIRLSMEQCSSERTAVYKSTLCEGEVMADLTGGFGVDCYFIGQKFRKVFYVEENDALCTLARHNFSVLGFSTVEVCALSAEKFLENSAVVDMFYLDPARRDSVGRKVVALSDCSPDVTALAALLKQKSRSLLLKLSPMLDIASVLRQFPCTQQVHIVSVDGECKELLFLIKWDKERETQFLAVDLQRDQQQMFSFAITEEQNAICEYADEVLAYLYEPNASVLKSGAFRLLAQRFDLKKLHKNTHLYTSNIFVEGFPGRVFKVDKYGNFSKKNLNVMLGDLKQANISVRNFPDSVDVLRKRLKLKEGGDDFLFACTNANDEKLLIRCKRCMSLS
ncbi:MAG: SAM-dependent methyltransferase [Paludibacteraceae bacterium]|nr:SAM-dependent methyltransferase [Paludibacteraceae bacterium]